MSVARVAARIRGGISGGMRRDKGWDKGGIRGGIRGGNDRVELVSELLHHLEVLRAFQGTAACATTPLIVGRPTSCVHENVEVINPHTVGSLTIPRPSIK